MHREIYDKLKEVARAKRTITYKELATVLGLDWNKDYGKCRQIFPVLGAVSTSEVEQGHPMLSALAVRQDGTPGSGFYVLAQDLGRYHGKNERSFWIEERDEVWHFWSSQRVRDPK